VDEIVEHILSSRARALEAWAAHKPTHGAEHTHANGVQP